MYQGNGDQNGASDGQRLEKQHQCHCGKQFTRLSELERHNVVHTGDRPYSCELCGRSYSTASNRNRHSRWCVVNTPGQDANVAIPMGPITHSPATGSRTAQQSISLFNATYSGPQYATSAGNVGVQDHNPSARETAPHSSRSDPSRGYHSSHYTTQPSLSSSASHHHSSGSHVNPGYPVHSYDGPFHRTQDPSPHAMGPGSRPRERTHIYDTSHLPGQTVDPNQYYARLHLSAADSNSQYMAGTTGIAYSAEHDFVPSMPTNASHFPTQGTAGQGNGPSYSDPNPPLTGVIRGSRDFDSAPTVHGSDSYVYPAGAYRSLN